MTNVQELLANQLLLLQRQVDSIDETVVSCERLRLTLTAEIASIKESIRLIDEAKQ